MNYNLGILPKGQNDQGEANSGGAYYAAVIGLEKHCLED
jgi:hypothetical protein